MKKLIKLNGFLAAGLAALMFVGCNNASKKGEDVVVEPITVVDGAHSARNSLDYKGTYNGVLPTASGSGMDVTVVLDDSTYVRTTTYVGKKDAPSIEKGSFTWNDAGNTITLTGVMAPNQYFVGENSLIHLDMDGNIIEGDLADKYILSKK